MKRTLIALSTLFCAATAAAAPFKLTSTEVKEGGAMPDKLAFNSFGCTGQNVSPTLEWSNPPPGTKSFALMVHDPDAPTGGSGFWHWVVYNIPAEAKSLPAGAGKADNSALPKGAKQGNTDFGSPGYGGPCPRLAAAITTTCSRCTRSRSTNSICQQTRPRRSLDSTSTPT
jgi:phosphatidylethanolamine-binding protein (PEBP) family uncharacterized protein